MVFQTKIFKMDGVLYRSPKGSGKSYVKSNKNENYPIAKGHSCHKFTSISDIF